LIIFFPLRYTTLDPSRVRNTLYKMSGGKLGDPKPGAPNLTDGTTEGRRKGERGEGSSGEPGDWQKMAHRVRRY
jgi:hypothetical protein